MTRTVVVLAGGLGTRVAHLTGPDLPKALLPVGDRPFIDLKIAELVAAGAHEVVLLVGHNSRELDRHLEGEQHFGATVRCIEDGPELLGTGGAIRRALDQLPQQFWITYGDSLLDVPMPEVEAFAKTVAAEGVMVVLENVDRWETSNVSVRDDRVVAYEKGAPAGSHRFIDYGMLLLARDAFAEHPEGTNFDLGIVLHEQIAAARLGAWIATERFHDIGTETAWRETDEWVREHALWDRLQERIEQREHARDLLDRDGVVVESRRAPGQPAPPDSLDDVTIPDGVADGLQRLRAAGYALVVVTNQPDVARGNTTRESVDAIHQHLRDRLPIDAIYVCFHTGAECECRKPRPGMLLDAARDLDLDLERSWMIGDRWVDIAAGAAAGAATVLLERDYSWDTTSSGSPPDDLVPDHRARTFAEAVGFVFPPNR